MVFAEIYTVKKHFSPALVCMPQANHNSFLKLQASEAWTYEHK